MAVPVVVAAGGASAGLKRAAGGGGEGDGGPSLLACPRRCSGGNGGGLRPVTMAVFGVILALTVLTMGGVIRWYPTGSPALPLIKPVTGGAPVDGSSSGDGGGGGAAGGGGVHQHTRWVRCTSSPQPQPAGGGSHAGSGASGSNTGGSGEGVEYVVCDGPSPAASPAAPPAVQPAASLAASPAAAGPPPTPTPTHSAHPSVASGYVLATSPHPPYKPRADRLVLLSTDLHISLIADIKDIVARHFGARIGIIDESLSGSCGSMGTCAQRLKVLAAGDAERNIYATAALKRSFFDAYAEGGWAGDDLVTAADVIHCSHPTGMCEFYMPFNKSMILWATTRFEQGRERSPDHFAKFVRNFRAMAALPGTSVMANSVYDAHYVHYFTGIMPEYVPSLCAYPGVMHTWIDANQPDAPPGRAPRARMILIHGWRPSPARIARLSLAGLLEPLINGMRARGLNYEIEHIRDYYTGRYEYAELCEHPAMFHMPYQVSVMSFFEQYRMGIPIIAPGPKLLTRWQLEYGMVSERTWDMVFHQRVPHGSIIGRHPDADEPYDPNDDDNAEAIEYWLRFSDYYTFPHIITFESWDELAEKMATLDLREVSRAMLAAAAEMETRVVASWRRVFDRVVPAAARPSLAGKAYDERMNALYGVGGWEDYI